jgi:phospholipase C
MRTRPTLNRRTALRYGAATAGLAAVSGLSLLGDDLVSSLAEPRRPGDISDVEHVVVFMQENRSFDHYYGSLSGVRGFGDNATVDGVFAQPDIVGTLAPFRVDTTQVDGQRLDSLDHSWDGVHQAWADGIYNDWISANGPLTNGLPDAGGHPIPLRARRCVHHL